MADILHFANFAVTLHCPADERRARIPMTHMTDNHATHAPVAKAGLQSQVISLLRFPLIVAVVVMHSAVADAVPGAAGMAGDAGRTLYEAVEALFVVGVCHVAVPAFFFISGCLFFREGVFTAGMYKAKLKKRCRTLLVPYLFWNAAAAALMFLGQTFMGGLSSGRQKLLADYSVADWLGCFWSVGDTGMPMCYPLWFMRDLMVLALLSPLFYAAIRRAGAALPLAAGALWVAGVTGRADFCVLSLEDMAFFSWGAYYGIRGKDFAASFRRLPAKAVAAAYAALVILPPVLRHAGVDDGGALSRAAMFTGLVAAVLVAARMAEGGKKAGGRLTQSSFFIYAYHAMPTLLMVKTWARYVPATGLTMTLGQLAIPALAVAAGVLLYMLSAKLMPRFTAVITGGRGKELKIKNEK